MYVCKILVGISCFGKFVLIVIDLALSFRIHNYLSLSITDSGRLECDKRGEVIGSGEVTFFPALE